MYSTTLDGGWGWVVVISAFIAQMLSDGISYGFGILYVDLMATFQGSSAEISSIGSLSYGSFCFIGPVAGALTVKFGYRFVTVLGAVLEALGVFLSAFTPNLEFMYFSVGILIGVGGGMMYIASFVCVSAYFESKRPLATSISSCGSSAGTFMFGFLYRVCIDHYGWRGALLLFSGLMLNGVVCGTLFRPFLKNQNAPAYELEVIVDFNESSKERSLMREFRDTNVNAKEDNPRFQEKENEPLHFDASITETDKTNEEQEPFLTNNVDMTDHTFRERSDYRKINNDNDRNSNDEYVCHSSNIVTENIVQTMNCNSTKQLSTNIGETKQKHTVKSIASLLLGTTNLHLFKDPGFILYGVSTFLFTFGYGIPFVLIPDMGELNGFTPTEAAWVISEFGIAAIFAKFFFGAMSQMFTKKYNRANVTLNSISVTLSGLFIACAPWAYSYSSLLVVGGAFGFLSAAANVLISLVMIDLLGNENLPDSLGWMNFISGVGFTAGPVVAAAVNTLVTLVLIELLGDERLADAFGWLNIFGGVGYTTGPFVAGIKAWTNLLKRTDPRDRLPRSLAALIHSGQIGWLFDVTNTYVSSFMAAGISLVLSGLVLLPMIIPCNVRHVCNLKK